MAKILPLADASKYTQYMRYHSLWFCGVLVAYYPMVFGSDSIRNPAILVAYGI
jgi:hypothetical protein